MDIGSAGTTALFNLVVNLMVGLLILLFTRLWDLKRWPFGYFMIYQSMKELKDTAQDLKARADDIKVRVAEAELDQKTCMNEVQVWLERVKSILLDVEDIKLEHLRWKYFYGSVHMIFKLNLVGIWKRYKVGKSIAEKLKEVKQLHAQGAFSVVAIRMPPPAIQEIPCNTKVIAMDLNRDEILRHLDDEGVKIIGIYGMGGVGKTTLLEQINSYLGSNQPLSFFKVIFLLVSRSFDVEELRKKMSKRLGLSSWQQDDIYNYLKDKKLLLLLDDLWERIELVDLGIPVEERKCKVVFTTRSISVCGYMDADKAIQVKCLPDKEAWNLFKKKVGEKMIASNPKIECVAKDVARECGGLPLAITTIARAMSTKKTWVEWQNALNLLRRSQHHNTPGMQGTMFPKLEFSYQSLQNDTMRECFLTCSLWPEDSLIYKDFLVESWMGLGLMDDFTELNEVYDRGYSIIGGLIDSCLLEPCGYTADSYLMGESGYVCEDFVKMHDVIRDMALWIASKCGKNWLVEGDQPQKWKDQHCVSLMTAMISHKPEQLPECPNLLVLMLRQSSFNLRSIPVGLFNCMPALMYLDLSGCNFQILPEELGNLVNLVLLNLSRTPIQYLPEELGNLVNLKYLFLQDMLMYEIPFGILSNLQALEVLNLRRCYLRHEEELYCFFEELHRLGRSLKGLSVTVDKVRSLERLSNSAQVFTIAVLIHKLEGVDSFELFSPVFLGAHGIGDNLRELEISFCNSLEVLTMDSSQAVGPARLQKLSVGALPLLHEIKWSRLTLKGFLCLQSVYIHCCPRLKNISWASHLPSLDYLWIGGCSEMEVLFDGVEAVGSVEEVAGEEEPISTLPRLRKLELAGLPNLASICNTTFVFPSLERLFVEDCPCLKKLPFNSKSIPSDLEVIEGKHEWWAGLQWEDECIKSSLSKYFSPSTFTSQQNITFP